jgi:hypothetical protein
MSGESDSLKTKVEESEIRMNILEAILVSSVDEKNSMLPNIQEFILSEVINGTIDYIGGTSDENYVKRRNDQKFGGYEKNIYENLEREIEKSEKKLSPKVQKAIFKLCKNNTISPDGPAANYTSTDLYEFFRHILPHTFTSKISMPMNLLYHTKHEIYPKLSPEEIQDIEGIGKAMRKHIDIDLEYIRAHYHW